MAAPRLPSLYSHLFKASRGWEPPQRFSALSRARDPRAPATASQRGRRPQSTFGQQRYGQAAEPMKTSKEKQEEPPKQELLPPLPVVGGARKASPKTRSAEQESSKATSQANGTDTASTTSNSLTDTDTQPDRVSRSTPQPPPAPAGTSGVLATSPAPAQSETQDPPPKLSSSLELAVPQGSQPLERVLHMDTRSGSGRHPHLETPPYVHHFDTYTLVNDLGKGGFTQEQSITLMKGVRSLLAVNLDLARDGLVSKSDVENESYLFRAATSELRTEIQNSRQSAIRAQRSDLAHLQHDSDIVAQRMTQELNTLRDELRGMFDERKMSVRHDQREAVASIEEVNRRIQVHLLSEGKSRIEALRWSLAKRAVTAIVATAAVGLLFLRVITNSIRHRKDEALEREAQLKHEAANLVLDDSRGSYLSRSNPMGAPGDSDAVLASAKSADKDGISYVSLG